MNAQKKIPGPAELAEYQARVLKLIEWDMQEKDKTITSQITIIQSLEKDIIRVRKEKCWEAVTAGAALGGGIVFLAQKVFLLL